MSLNPGAGYWIDIFSHQFAVNLSCLLERPKIKEKEPEDGPFKNKY